MKMIVHTPSKLRFAKSRTLAALPLVLTLAACATPITPSLPGAPVQSGVTVTGTGEAVGSPNTAFVQLGIEVVDTDVASAINEANEVAEGILAGVTSLGVPEEDVQTVNFNVHRREQRVPDTGQVRGVDFVVTNAVRVKVTDLSIVGQVIEAGLDAGANTVSGLSFGVDDPSELLEEARRNAAQDARARAEQLAEELGVTLGEPISIHEGGAVIPVQRAPIALGVAAESALVDAPPISEGQLSISAAVTVTFAIE